MATSGSATVCESKTACCSDIDSAIGGDPAGTTPETADATAHANGPAPRRLSIGTVAAMLLGVSGIALATACMRASSASESVVTAGPTAAMQPKDEARVMVKCAECGVVESVTKVEIVGAEGALTASDHDAALGKSTTRYQVTVRMRDGSRRVFMDANLADWRPGERMTIIESAISAAN